MEKTRDLYSVQFKNVNEKYEASVKIYNSHNYYVIIGFLEDESDRMTMYCVCSDMSDNSIVKFSMQELKSCIIEDVFIKEDIELWQLKMKMTYGLDGKIKTRKQLREENSNLNVVKERIFTVKDTVVMFFIFSLLPLYFYLLAWSEDYLFGRDSSISFKKFIIFEICLFLFFFSTLFYKKNRLE